MNEIMYSLLLFILNCYKTFEKCIIYMIYPGFKWLITRNFKNYGIQLNGPSNIDVQLKNEKEFFIRVTNHPTLGLGETYMDGHWTVQNLDGLMEHIFKYEFYKIYLNCINRIISFFLFDTFNLQTKSRSWEVAQRHYDKGNQLFKSFLDPTMNYSCGYWKNAGTLEESQINKMKLIGDKLKLKPGMRVLDIGCGWGGLCKYLAIHYNVHVVGCTISKEQAEIAQKLCKNLSVDIQLIDYRDIINEKFDRIVSVGMFEHVGVKNYNTFFNIAHNCLVPNGIFLLHTIGVNDPGVPRIEPWFHKYIFPNGMLPFHTDITKYSNGCFILEDWHNFGNDYSKTLLEWRNNFEKNWSTINHLYDDKFYRMWYFYLSLSIGAFRSRKYQLWQIVFSKNGIVGGYESIR